MKIATFNVNGVNGRLPVLLRWLEEAKPDVVCLQELKAPQEKFPAGPIRDAGYGAIWQGQKSWNGVAILARGPTPSRPRRGLPGDDDDTQSRYLEAAVDGILIGCLYLPNGNPAPGPKFDYKLRWFERLIDHAAELLALDAPVVLAGDFNVMPTELDVYKPERWVDDALFRPEVREAFPRLVGQGWTDAMRTLHPDEPIYTFWDYFRNAYARNAGLRIDHLLLSPAVAERLVAAGVDRDVRGGRKRATTRRLDRTRPTGGGHPQHGIGVPAREHDQRGIALPMNFIVDGPQDSAVTVLLAHGAGAPMDSPAMNALAQALAGVGLRTARFEFAYMAARLAGQRKPPPKAETLIPEFREAVRSLDGAGRLIIGGKSMGGRVASMIADDLHGRARSRGCYASAIRFIRPASRASSAPLISPASRHQRSSARERAMSSGRARTSPRTPCRPRSSCCGSRTAIMISGRESR